MLTVLEMIETRAPIEAIEQRLNNEHEVSEQLYKALKLMPCVCTREYPYSGVGKHMCRRCSAMVLWETLTTGRSETKAFFEVKIL